MNPSPHITIDDDLPRWAWPDCLPLWGWPTIREWEWAKSVSLRQTRWERPPIVDDDPQRWIPRQPRRPRRPRIARLIAGSREGRRDRAGDQRHRSTASRSRSAKLGTNKLLRILGTRFSNALDQRRPCLNIARGIAIARAASVACAFAGAASRPISPGVPWSDDFMRAYGQALEGVKARPNNIGADRTIVGTIDALIVSYYRLIFPTLKASTQAKRRAVLTLPP